MESMIVIQNLKKQIGQRLILDDLSLTIPSGSIYGFVGENGAGKTTTMKIILGLLAADSGTVTIAGQTVKYGDSKTNQNIGYLPDVPAFYNYLSAKEYLALCGKVSGLTKNVIAAKIPTLLSKVGLNNTSQKIGGFSRGMKQRLCLAQALLNDPKLLICDEPTSALDPIGRKEVLTILKNLKNETTVLFSTHILHDVESICDHIAILNEGKIQLEGALENIKAEHNKYYELQFKDTADRSYFLKHTAFNGQKKDSLTLLLPVLNQEDSGLAIVETLARLKVVPRKLKLVEPTLEDIFLKVVAK